MTRTGLARQDGFTLLELLLISTIIATLVAIAVPSFLAWEARANEAAAKEDVRTAVPAVEAYQADCGTYANAAAAECVDGVAHTFDVSGLKTYDPAVTLRSVQSVGDGSGYCIDMSVGGKVASITGPGGTVTSSACPPSALEKS
jgi:type II secretory pathway pseudopilin PulG